MGAPIECWCPLGQPCHADVLLEIANRGEGETVSIRGTAGRIDRHVAQEGVMPHV